MLYIDTIYRCYITKGLETVLIGFSQTNYRVTILTLLSSDGMSTCTSWSIHVSMALPMATYRGGRLSGC